MREYYSIGFMVNGKQEESKLYDVSTDKDAIEAGIRFAKRNGAEVFKISFVKERMLLGIIQMLKRKRIFLGTIDEATAIS
jgi:hypothetical protein